MSNIWNLQEDYAEAQAQAWRARLQPTNPQRGVQLQTRDDHVWTIFEVHAIPRHSLATEEVYIRQGDLIARFDQAEQDEFAFQIDYRIIESRHSAAAGIELWLSVQTDNLDSEPILVVHCETPEGEPWETLDHASLMGDKVAGEPNSGPAAIVGRTSSHTGIWLIEPTDQHQAAVLSSPFEPQQRLELFGQFMEKGVIRRARMRFFVLEGNTSAETLQQLYIEFAQSPLPLTA